MLDQQLTIPQVQRCLGKETVESLMVILPDGELKESIINAFNLKVFPNSRAYNSRFGETAISEQSIEEAKLIKEELVRIGISEGQQNGVIGMWFNDNRMASTYLAAILPDGEFRNGVIEGYNNANPDNHLNEEGIKALRCFVVGTETILDGKKRKFHGFRNADGTDYQKAGKVVLELLRNKETFDALTLLAEDQIHNQAEALRLLEEEEGRGVSKYMLGSHDLLLPIINSYRYPKGSVLADGMVLNIFKCYVENYLRERDAKAEEKDSLPEGRDEFEGVASIFPSISLEDAKPEKRNRDEVEKAPDSSVRPTDSKLTQGAVPYASPKLSCKLSGSPPSRGL